MRSGGVGPAEKRLTVGERQLSMSDHIRVWRSGRGRSATGQPFPCRLGDGKRVGQRPQSFGAFGPTAFCADGTGRAERQRAPGRQRLGSGETRVVIGYASAARPAVERQAVRRIRQARPGED